MPNLVMNTHLTKAPSPSSGSNFVNYCSHLALSNSSRTGASSSTFSRPTPIVVDSCIVSHGPNCSLCLNPLKEYPSLKFPCIHLVHTLCAERVENQVSDSTNHYCFLTSSLKTPFIKFNTDQQHQHACCICRRTYPSNTAEYFFIEGCRIFFILKSQVKYTATSSKEKSSECKTRKKNEEEMVKLWRSAAHMGHAQAQMNLAHIYNHGDCVPKDFKKAAYWYYKQALIGNARAQFRLARLRSNGQGGIKQDFANAAELYKLSAKQGYPKAQLCYGTMLLHGKGCERNKTEAADWLRRSADQGNEEAEFILANVILHNDDFERFHSTKIEADKGNVESLFELGELYLHGQGCDHDEKEAAICFGKAANENHLESKFRLGQMFLNGIGVEQSNQYALSWFKEAADQNHCDAQCTLANMFWNHVIEIDDFSSPSVLPLHPKSLEEECEHAEELMASIHSLLVPITNEEAPEDVDFDAAFIEMISEFNEMKHYEISENNNQFLEGLYRSAAVNGSLEAQLKYGNIMCKREGIKSACKWYVMAAEQGSIDAMCFLGQVYYFGKGGVEQSYLEAARWYKAAAELNCSEAQRHFGFILYHGLGLEHPFTKAAATWYLKAAHSGDDKAQFYIGKMLIKGIGVQTDYKDGYHWLLKSANQGNVDAEYNLAKYLSSQNIGKLIGEMTAIENEKVEALKWCQVAVDNGHTKAQSLLEMLHK